MLDFYKINFDTDNYEYKLAYSIPNFQKKQNDTSIFKLPQSKMFLTVFIIITDFKDSYTAQLVNCITSIKVQTYLNIDIRLLNFDKSYNNKNIIKKIASNTNVTYTEAKSGNIILELEKAVQDTNSEYISIINYDDIFPRIKEIENIINLLYQTNYDYITLTVKFKNENNTDYKHPENNKRKLKSTMNYHYSAFFKRKKLSKIDFSKIKPILIDEALANYFMELNYNGNHMLSTTQMNLLESIK